MQLNLMDSDNESCEEAQVWLKVVELHHDNTSTILPTFAAANTTDLRVDSTLLMH